MGTLNLRATTNEVALALGEIPLKPGLSRSHRGKASFRTPGDRERGLIDAAFAASAASRRAGDPARAPQSSLCPDGAGHRVEALYCAHRKTEWHARIG
jgi:hypothetical protein